MKIRNFHTFWFAENSLSFTCLLIYLLSSDECTTNLFFLLFICTIISRENFLQLFIFASFFCQARPFQDLNDCTKHWPDDGEEFRQALFSFYWWCETTRGTTTLATSFFVTISRDFHAIQSGFLDKNLSIVCWNVLSLLVISYSFYFLDI